MARQFGGLRYEPMYQAPGQEQRTRKERGWLWAALLRFLTWGKRGTRVHGEGKQWRDVKTKVREGNPRARGREEVECASTSRLRALSEVHQH